MKPLQSYPLHQPKAGYSEQHPEDWVSGTLASLKQLVEKAGIGGTDAVDGISWDRCTGLC